MPRLSSSFFVLRAGLFTGSFVTLFVVYAILAHLCGIFSSSSSDEAGYMETVYPIFRCSFLLRPSNFPHDFIHTPLFPTFYMKSLIDMHIYLRMANAINLQSALDSYVVFTIIIINDCDSSTIIDGIIHTATSWKFCRI